MNDKDNENVEVEEMMIKIKNRKVSKENKKRRVRKLKDR